MTPNEPCPPEPRVTINGVPLTSAQALTVRVAIESFASSLANEGCGSDEHGLRMTEGYFLRIGEIRKLIAEKLYSAEEIKRLLTNDFLRKAVHDAQVAGEKESFDRWGVSHHCAPHWHVLREKIAEALRK